MPRPNARAEIRAAARRFEEALPAGRRKQLGQYFTASAWESCSPILPSRRTPGPSSTPWRVTGISSTPLRKPPMNGVSRLSGWTASRLTRRRLRRAAKRLTHTGHIHTLVSASAFDSATLVELGHRRRYGLAITNPPYDR